MLSKIEFKIVCEHSRGILRSTIIIIRIVCFILSILFRIICFSLFNKLLIISWNIFEIFIDIFTILLNISKATSIESFINKVIDKCISTIVIISYISKSLSITIFIVNIFTLENLIDSIFKRFIISSSWRVRC